jgi:hypothetical protein
MGAQKAFGLDDYPIRNAGTQRGPSGGIRVSATRNGDILTGTFRLYLWFIEESGEVEGGPEVYTLPFTAKRVR